MSDDTKINSTAHGSDFWRGAEDLEENNEERLRANALISAVKWDVLSELILQQNGGKPCYFHDKFSIGHFNLVKRVSFEGDEAGSTTDWVVRLRLPSDGIFQSPEKLDPRKIMEVEVASMKFYKAKTSIPVPLVIAYDSSLDNAVGAPYIIMEYIYGNAAGEMREIKESALSFYGTPEQDRKFRRQVAQIQATISSFTFPHIGSLYVNDQGEFAVGPDVVTGLGPWSNSADYYADVVSHIYETLPRDERRDEVVDSTALFVPSALSYLARVHGHEPTGPFRLVNNDFGTHNILVNEDFDVVGVIDFDGVMAAPIGVVAQYPLFIGFEVDEVDEMTLKKFPFKAQVLETNKPRCAEYNEFLRHFEDALEMDNGLSRVSDQLKSCEALVYSGMRSCHSRNLSAGGQLQRMCHRLLKEFSDGTEAAEGS